MNPSGGFTGGLSPDAVHTSIDTAMYEEFNREMQPGYIRATDDFFFKQGDTVGDAFIYAEDSNVGEFTKTAEQEEILVTDTFLGNKTTKYSQKYTKKIAISDEAFRADMVGKRAEYGRQIADRARMTSDKYTLLDTYGDAFDGSTNKTPDGDTLASNSHTTLKGDTVDNLETGSLTPDNLWTLVQSLTNQKAQDGDSGGHYFEGYMSCHLLYKTAKEVMNSTLSANTAENNVNIFDTDYGHVRIGASQFLNSQFNGATNASTSYHIIGRNHMIVRKEFYGLTTYMTPLESTSNDSYIMIFKFHEVAFPGSYTGYAGANGTT